ncbi:hypothetical protein ACH5RR_012267 [Cinchona calisaya]|uniref:F-box domain-containing protein n=1 Tax=Cinchona calisaya TaxID=153742 RepID=A0ABD3A771_9GENT
MKRAKASEENLYLPEGIIHHILSYLNPKEAAQVAVLSKEWLSAWKLNPKLKFDDRYFENNNHLIPYPPLVKFQNYVNSTLLRHQKEHRHIIHEFHIDVTFSGEDDFASVLDGWLEIVVKKRVKVIKLGLKASDHWYKVPEIILKAKSLTNLSLVMCKFQKKFNGKLLCTNLLSLHLTEVRIGDKMFRAFIEGCPLINDLSICYCSGLKKIKLVNLSSLKKFFLYDLDSDYQIQTLQVDAPSLQFMELGWFVNQSFLEVYASHTLKHLVLFFAKMSDIFFHNLVHKLPNLEILEVNECDDFERISLRSNSLKYIILSISTFGLEVEIDAPNLIKFEYGCYANLQCLTFSGIFFKQVVPRYISVSSCGSCIDSSWFLKFNGMISNLSPSDVSLYVSDIEEINGSIKDIPNFSANAIEIGELELGVEKRSSRRYNSDCDRDGLLISDGDDDGLFSDFLDALFWACHPKTIVQDWDPNIFSDDTGFIKFLYKKLVWERRYEEGLYSIKFWEHHLKKVEFEIFDDEGVEEIFCQQQEPLDWETVPKTLDESVGDIPRFAVHAVEVEELELELWTDNSDCDEGFLDILFWACHPKTIVQNRNPFKKLLYKKLIMETRDQELYKLPAGGTIKFWRLEPLDWETGPKASKVLLN